MAYTDSYSEMPLADHSNSNHHIKYHHFTKLIWQYFRQTYPDVPIGTWTDDGSQTLALLHSLTQNNCIDIRDFAGRLCNWLYEGQYTPDGIVFDCGIQTSHALNRIRY